MRVIPPRYPYLDAGVMTQYDGRSPLTDPQGDRIPATLTGDAGRFRLTLTILSLVILVVMISEAMLTAALPEITHEFHPPGVFGTWILPMVLLIGASAAPFIGSIGDRLGRKRLLVFCLLLYAVGIIAAGFSLDIWTLLLFRAFQGAGIAAFPLAYAIIVERFPAEKADIGVGIMSAMYGGGTFIGIIIGSVLTQYLSWRYTYYLLIPVSLLLLVAILWFIPEGKSRERRSGDIDAKGFLLLLAALFLFLLLLSGGSGEKGSLVLDLLLAALSLIFFLLFLRQEQRSREPMLDICLLRDPVVLMILLIGFLGILVFFMMVQAIPFIIQAPSGLNLPEIAVGILLIPGTLCDLAAGPLTGRLISRRGFRIACILGAALFVVAAVLCLLLPITQISLVLVWMIFSAGMSVTATASLIAVMVLVPADRTAGVTGLAQSGQSVGGMIGPVLTGLLFSGHLTPFMREGSVWEFPDAVGFQMVYAAILILSGVILTFSLALPRIRKNPSGSP